MLYHLLTRQNNPSLIRKLNNIIEIYFQFFYCSIYKYQNNFFLQSNLYPSKVIMIITIVIVNRSGKIKNKSLYCFYKREFSFFFNFFLHCICTFINAAMFFFVRQLNSVWREKFNQIKMKYNYEINNENNEL